MVDNYFFRLRTLALIATALSATVLLMSVYISIFTNVDFTLIAMKIAVVASVLLALTHALYKTSLEV